MIPQSPSPPFYTSDGEGSQHEDSEGRSVESKFQFDLSMDSQDSQAGHTDHGTTDTAVMCDHINREGVSEGVETTTRDVSPAET